ncbi:MAG: TetR/AcrR family transcriptional regulator [Firmicutes bacterium]|nr:TetR/AcrR family transcriptional regulator [Bacillota bacterium]
MPTKAFYNLEIKKQKQLLDAARKEFSIHLFEEASINKIIKDINMPRGSFYLYFENKEDIYLYILENYLKSFKNVLFELLKENNNDIFKSMVCLYDYIVDNKKLDHTLITNIFINMNSKQIEMAIPKLLKKEVDGSIISATDFKNYNVEEDEIEVIMSILFPLLFMSIGKTYSNTCDKKNVREFYIKQINIIKKGLERR